MIRAEEFIAAGRDRGFRLYSGVPCSYLTPFINYTIGAEGLRYVGAANEGDAVAIAAGAALGGLRSVAMFQNSGLGNAVNPLTSLTYTFRIPVLVIVTWRGQPGGAADEPQHELMGQVTPQLLELMQIPWALFPDSPADIGPALDRATAHLQTERRPYAFIMRKGSVQETPLDLPPAARSYPAPAEPEFEPPQARRHEVLRAIRAAAGPDDLVVATTGFTGRELYALGDTDNQLYMVGSMGCAVSLALGLAIAQPSRRVIAIDGDGAALMRLGALPIVGFESPANLVHILVDNGRHESTGGQATVAPAINFPAIASASGYRTALSVADPEALRAWLSRHEAGPSFVHVPVHPGIPKALPRPDMRPEEVAARFRRHLGVVSP